MEREFIHPSAKFLNFPNPTSSPTSLRPIVSLSSPTASKVPSFVNTLNLANLFHFPNPPIPPAPPTFPNPKILDLVFWFFGIIPSLDISEFTHGVFL